MGVGGLLWMFTLAHVRGRQWALEAEPVSVLALLHQLTTLPLGMGGLVSLALSILFFSFSFFWGLGR